MTHKQERLNFGSPTWKSHDWKPLILVARLFALAEVSLTCSFGERQKVESFNSETTLKVAAQVVKYRDMRKKRSLT